MKKLFAVLLAVAMLLSLGVTAFATDPAPAPAPTPAGGTILIADPPADTMYKAFKIFDVTVNSDTSEMTYTIDATSTYKALVMDIAATGTDANGDPYSALNPKSRVKGLEFIPLTSGGAIADSAGAVAKYQVKRTSDFSAADFANTLKTGIDASGAGTVSDNPYDTNNYKKTGPRKIDVTEDGYYLILGASMTANDNTGTFKAADLKAPAALTTVFGGNDVQVQAKHDMPLDKTVDDADDDTGGVVYDDDGNGVNLGDKLNYKIEAKLPDDPQNENYIYYFSDSMSDGLTFGNKLTIQVEDGPTYVITYKPKDLNATTPVAAPSITVTRNPAEVSAKSGPRAEDFTLITDPEVALEGNQVRFGANGKTWELSLDVASQAKDANDKKLSLIDYKGKKVTITYDATVNEDAVAEVLENKVVLVFGEDNDHVERKDDSTKNYDSAIVIDKFAEGNNSQKLKDAEFVLYRRNPTEDTAGTAADESKDAYGNQVYTKQYYQLKATGSSKYVAANSFSPYYFQTVAFENGELKLTDAQKAALYVELPANSGKYFPKFEKIELSWIAVADENVIPYSNLNNPTNANTITKVVTDVNGFAEFGYLPDSLAVADANGDTLTDGYYYIYETKAPVDYTRLLQPIQIVVDGSASVDPSMTPQQQDQVLTNMANIANAPGSTLPSTGGVGATLLTIGGVALMLAAGAYLVLRRKEQE